MTTRATVNDLNSLLKREISACDTYEQALRKVDDPSTRSVLENNYCCHSDRVSKLTNAILSLGGTPVQSAGAWSTFSKLIEKGTAVFGLKAAIKVIEEGEDNGLAEYRAVMERVGSSSTLAGLLSKQENSHRAMRELRCSFKV